MKHPKPEGYNLNTLAAMIPLHVDLGDVGAVIKALTDAHQNSADFYPLLDEIIETADRQRRYEWARDSSTGIGEILAGLMLAPMAVYLVGFSTLFGG